MKIKILTLLAIAVSIEASSQGIELGIKAGLTGASGTTKLPENKTNQNGAAVTAYKTTANSDGMGFNFLAGIYGKVNLPAGWFVLGEVQYSQFTLPQKTENVVVNVDNPGSASTTPATPSSNFNQTYSSIDVKSQLNGINVPILIGKQFANKMLRVYIGPQFLFVTKVEQTRTFHGGKNVITEYNNVAFENYPSANQAAIQSGVDKASPPLTSTTENLANHTTGASADRQVVKTVIGLEAGIGVTIPVVGIGVDLRYSVPLISGVYTNKDITGYLGITTLTLSYKLFKFGL